MTTATLQHAPALQLPQSSSVHYNKSAFVSMAFVILFAMYVFLPHPAILRPLSSLAVLFILVVPLCALILSVLSIRHARRTQIAERGTSLGYIALSLMMVYFMVAVAIPVVLIGCYILYTYII